MMTAAVTDQTLTLGLGLCANMLATICNNFPLRFNSEACAVILAVAHVNYAIELSP